MLDSLHEYVIDKLQEVKGHWPLVAEQTQMSIRTLEKIARREIADPGVSHIEKLARYFRSHKAN